MATRQDLRQSRLPRLASSPESNKPQPTTRKRKANDDIDAGPTKVRAMMDSSELRPLNSSVPVRPLTRSGANAASIRPTKGLPPPRKPLATANRQNTLPRGPRAGSAPPKTRSVSGIVNGRRTTPDSGFGRPGLRIASSSSVRSMKPLAFQSKLNDDISAKPESEARRRLIAAFDELDELKQQWQQERERWSAQVSERDERIGDLQQQLENTDNDLHREKGIVTSLKDNLAEKSKAMDALETQNTFLRGRCEMLASSEEAQKTSGRALRDRVAELEGRIEELESELFDAENLRRKLHNQVQELKGNIRVFCRVRPALADELKSPEGLASVAFPDKQEHKEIVVSSTSETATGGVRDNTLPFTFDRVFQPRASQHEVFEEISHLVQSCIDGYNVCIFAYGQTGSGKSYTMEGGSSDDARGMIPRAVRHVFSVAEQFQKKGWSYKMEGQFLEIYNETIVDLLGRGNEGKHEIKHEKGGRTSVTDVVVYPLHSPDQVQNLLSRAQARRTVHATLMNERSSRSHSVFTLRISGKNAASGETSEGTLNLVDLAGSERLEKSGALNHKDRLKETQAINKSLSALGDVIAALGERGASGEKHIPYRNSKSKWKFQDINVCKHFAIGNASRRIDMFLAVNSTTLGTAKKQQARLS
ncbi:kinesin-like nuclear fusion protein [Tulasnella sp. 403]|nr:kinesin-like nuclear fusion protein [Tulasnella sp. 403]